MDFVAIGEMLIDFLPGEEDGVYIRKAGGAPANVAVAVARNGLKSGFCGCLGNDDFGRFLVNTLEDNGVINLCPPLNDSATTTMAFVTLDERGDRSFTFARKPGADMLLDRDAVDKANVESCVLLHAGSCSLSRNPAADATAYALRRAKAAGRLVSFDVNYRSLMWDNDREACAFSVQEILPLVDFLKLSQEEEEMLGLPLELLAEKYDLSLVVETLGEDGAKCVWKDQIICVPGRKALCVDATGAGDAFWGAFLSCLLRSGVKSVDDLSRELIEKAMEHGNVAGWLCVQKKGAMESLPSAEEVEQILSPAK